MSDGYTTIIYDTGFRIHQDGSVTNYDGSPMSPEKMARCAPAIARMMIDAEAMKSKPEFLKGHTRRVAKNSTNQS